VKRRLVATADGLTAHEDLCASFDGVDASLHRGEGVLVNEAADDRVGLLGSPTLSADVFAPSLSTNSSAIAPSTTILRADMQICPDGGTRRSSSRRPRSQRSILQDDERVVAAQLQDDSPEMAARVLRELAPGLRRAGEVEPSDRGILDELVADRPRITPCVRDDVERPSGKPASAKISPRSRPPAREIPPAA
jgi:hypothetical protein